MAKVDRYSKKADGNKYIRPNFQVKEFACKDGSDTILLCEETVEILQAIRNYFGQPVHVNSGYRTSTYNKKVGGASMSQHVIGTAADISVKGIPPSAIVSYLEAFYPNHGIGLYTTFVHIDSRGYKVYWQYKGNAVVSSFKQGNLYLKYKASDPDPTVSAGSSGGEETDMTEKDVNEVPGWAEAEYQEAIDLGITDGSRPNDPVTRLEAAIMALRAAKAGDRD